MKATKDHLNLEPWVFYIPEWWKGHREDGRELLHLGMSIEFWEDSDFWLFSISGERSLTFGEAYELVDSTVTKVKPFTLC